MAKHGYELRSAQPGDAEALAELGARTFTENFGHLYTPENLQAFLDGVYAPRLQQDEIAHPDNHIMLAFVEGKMKGFAKSGPCKLPIENPPQPAYELHRLYVDGDAQGLGIGKGLIDDAMAFFKRRRAASIYVGVWQENHRAQAIYQKYGFETIGHYFFEVGDHQDDELIMQLKCWKTSAI